MKCPTIIKGKKKGSAGTCGAELQTKRTLANGTKVRRERACPKCHARFWTVEQFEKDIEATEIQHKDQVDKLGRMRQDAFDEMEEYCYVLNCLQGAMEKAGKRVKT